MKLSLINPKILLLILLLVGASLRFYNLNWGAPFYFHPDERNIASSVTQLQFPHQLNPHFFAYGSLPIYNIFTIGIIVNLLTVCRFAIETCSVHFDQAILLSRIFSAFFSTILIFLVFLIGQKIHSRKAGLIAAFFATSSVGFIQFAHFGTFEMWITFFVVLLFYCSILFLETKKNEFLFLSAVIVGITIAIKISSIVLLLVPFFLLVKTIKKNKSALVQIPIKGFSLLVISVLMFFLTNPFAILDFQSFKGSILYESGVATGELPVFYSQGFTNTIPVLYQLFYVYPFLLNPFLTCIFILSFIYLSFKIIYTKNKLYLLLATFYLILFLSQALLFVKWTRYIVPTLPFIYLIIAIAIVNLIKYISKRLNHQYTSILVIGSLVMTCFLFSFSYFITVLMKQDSRIEAYDWSKKNIPSHSQIMSEVYDLGIVPFNTTFSNISLFNFYDLDSNSFDFNSKTLQEQLKTIDYVILPSQRLLKSRLSNQNLYPKGFDFYEKLFSEVGFKKVFQTQCDIFCKIIYMGDQVFLYEESTSVFDRPTVFVFKKI